MAASFSRVEVGGVGMAGQHHGTGVVGDDRKLSEWKILSSGSNFGCVR